MSWKVEKIFTRGASHNVELVNEETNHAMQLSLWIGTYTKEEAKLQAAVIVDALNKKRTGYAVHKSLLEFPLTNKPEVMPDELKRIESILIKYGYGDFVGCNPQSDLIKAIVEISQQQYNGLPTEEEMLDLLSAYHKEMDNSKTIVEKGLTQIRYANKLRSIAQQQIQRYREFAEMIAEWKLPETGKFWDEECTRPTSYEAEYGSNGARDYFKEQAKQLLNK